MIYRLLIRPRLGPPAELEPAAPPRFAQAVGLVISIIGVIGYAAGWQPLGMAAAAAGLVAAFLNGIFGLCLGCEMYLLIRRIWPGRPSWSRPKPTRRFDNESFRRPRGRRLGRGA